MEMPALWKSQNDFHSPLEISSTSRDSHISTAVTHRDDIDANPTKLRLVAGSCRRPLGHLDGRHRLVGRMVVRQCLTSKGEWIER
jgi:hypothetical protein